MNIISFAYQCEHSLIFGGSEQLFPTNFSISILVTCVKLSLCLIIPFSSLCGNESFSFIYGDETISVGITCFKESFTLSNFFFSQLWHFLN
jgi:hypothetical protein